MPALDGRSLPSPCAGAAQHWCAWIARDTYCDCFATPVNSEVGIHLRKFQWSIDFGNTEIKLIFPRIIFDAFATSKLCLVMSVLGEAQQ